MAEYISFQPSDEFQAKAFSGNSSTNAITLATGFSPQQVWVKKSDGTSEMYVFDTVRGANYYLSLYETAAQVNDATSLTSFDANGFTMGSGPYNATGSEYISYCWNGGYTSVPSGGSKTPTAVNVNTTNGVGVYKWTGTGGATTIAHGLGAAPKYLIMKNAGSVYNWAASYSNTAWNDYLPRNSYGSTTTANWIQSTAPTDTLVYIGTTDIVNESSKDCILYAFTPIKGFSSMGNFTGNGSADGPFIYTGFKPRYVEIKRWDGGSCNWTVWDTTKNVHNLTDYYIYTDDGGSDNGYVQGTAGTGNVIDIYANGFKLKTTLGCLNGTNDDMRYLAIADKPIVSSNDVPAVAR